MPNSVESMISAHRRITIPLIIAGLFILMLYLIGFDVVDNVLSPDIFGFTGERFLEDNFVRLGIIVIFLYELIPFTFRFITNAGFFVGLIEANISPIAILMIVALGKLAGYYILYLVGRFASRLLKGRNRELASADHLLHKYKFFIFMAVPFLGAVGDVVVLIAGHERLGFLRVAPILLVASVLRISIWLFPFIAQLKLPDLI